MTIGERVWNRLRAEGGFVWTMSDGRKFVRFNRGCSPSPELQKILLRYRDDLKAFVDEMHAADDRRTPLGVGSSGPSERRHPKGRGNAHCDCHAKSRFGISPKPGPAAGFGGWAQAAIVPPAAVAVLASVLVVLGEISPATAADPSVPVGLVTVLSTIYSPGSGEGATINGGSASWKRS